MAGTYWLTVLPDAAKLEKGIKDAVKKAGQDISRGSNSSTGVGPEIIFGDERKWRDRARQMGRRVRDELRNSGAGEVLHDALVTAVDEAAPVIGKRIGEAIGDTKIGGALVDWAHDASDGLQHVSDAMKGIRDHDPSVALKGAADALHDIGQNDAAGVLEKVNTKATDVFTTFNEVKGSIKDTTEVLGALAAGSPAIIGALDGIAAAAGPIAAILGGSWALLGPGGISDQIGSALARAHPPTPFNSPIQGPPIEQTPAGQMPLPGQQQPAAPPKGAPPGVTYAPSTGAPDPLAPFDTGDGHASGGLLRGAGTGTSDSMLARVSTGEFVVNAASTAMWLPLLQQMNSGHLAKFGTGGLVSDQVNSLAGIPYSMGGFGSGGLDCSGLVSAVVNAYMGRPMFGSRMATPSEGSWLSSLGARSGRGGAGDLTILWWDGGTGGNSNGHTEAILPNGQVIEATPGGVKIGSGTTAANDGQWRNAMYIPKEMLQGAMHPQSGGGSSNAGSLGSSVSGASSGGSGGTGGGSSGAGGGSSIPDLGSLTGIASGGLKQTLGLDGSVFSDPTQWADVKSGMAALQFLTGLGGSIAKGRAAKAGDEVLGDTPAGDALGGLPFGSLLQAIPTGRKKGQSQDAPHEADQLPPGQFNPFGGAGGTGSGGVNVHAPGVADYLPARDGDGGQKPTGGIDNSVHVTATGMDHNKVAQKVVDIQTNRTRQVGPI